MSSNIEIICEWIRHPDNAETFTAGDLVMWANDRPTGEALSLKREFEAKDALISELVGALEPFANFGEYIDLETEGFSGCDEFQLMIGDHLMETFKVFDFGRARAALTKARERSNERYR